MRRFGLRPVKKHTKAERIWDPARGQWVNIHASTSRSTKRHVPNPQPIIRNGIHHTYNVQARIPTPPPAPPPSNTPIPRPAQSASEYFDTANLYREPTPEAAYDATRDQLDTAPIAEQEDDLPNLGDLRLAKVHHSLSARRKSYI